MSDGHAETCREGLVPDLLPARMLNEFVYCARLFHLEWVQSEWRESHDTLAGAYDHRRVDDEKGSLPTTEELGEEAGKATSVYLSAPAERLIARMDLVEHEGGYVAPVDYKHGRGPEEGLDVWEADRIQVGAQALILRDNGYKCDHAVVYYAASKKRVIIHIDDALTAETREFVRRALSVASVSETPPPLEDSPKCPRCSLAGICLPDETGYLAAALTDDVADVRRLYPARDDAKPVYVMTQGSRVGKRGEELDTWERDQGRQRARLIDVASVSLFGDVQVTTQALTALMGRGIPICYFSRGGWFYGMTNSIGSRNCYFRRFQYRAADEGERALEIARGLVARKVLNCRTLVRRNGSADQTKLLRELLRLVERVREATDPQVLLGLEGRAARLYFGAFSTMLKGAATHRFC